jgi:hypothetical protein
MPRCNGERSDFGASRETRRAARRLLIRPKVTVQMQAFAGCLATMLGTAGCRDSWLYAADEPYVRHVASLELSCAADDVDVRFIGTREVYDVDRPGRAQGAAFSVQGCGHVRVYECRYPPRPRDRRWGTESAAVCWAEGAMVVVGRL